MTAVIDLPARPLELAPHADEFLRVGVAGALTVYPTGKHFRMLAATDKTTHPHAAAGVSGLIPNMTPFKIELRNTPLGLRRPCEIRP